MTNDIENYEIVDPNDETHITDEKKKLLSYKKQLEEYNTLQDNEVSLEKRHSQLEDDIALLKKQIQIETTNLEKITEGLNSNQSQILISQLSELEEKINKIHNIKIPEIEESISGINFCTALWCAMRDAILGVLYGGLVSGTLIIAFLVFLLFKPMIISNSLFFCTLLPIPVMAACGFANIPLKKPLLKIYKKKEAKYYQRVNELHQKVKLLSEQNKNIVTDLAILQEEQLDSVNKLSVLAKEKEQKEAELIEVSEQITSEQRAIEFLHNKLLISQTYMLLETGETDSLEETETIEIKGRVKTLGEKQIKNY